MQVVAKETGEHRGLLYQAGEVFEFTPRVIKSKDENGKEVETVQSPPRWAEPLEVAEAEEVAPSSLEAMTKEQLLVFAKGQNIDGIDASLKKADIIALIEGNEAGE